MLSIRSREKIALGVFAVLVVLSLCGLGWYLFAGHSWNVAASNIDDTFGSMDGYTAIVYPGTEVPKTTTSKRIAASEAASETAEGAVAGQAAAQEADVEGATAEEVVPRGVASEEAGVEAAPSITPDEGSGTTAEDTAVGASVTGTRTPSGSLIVPLQAEEVFESYEEKGATVFMLDTENPEVYREGTILKKGEHRFGVLSVMTLMPPAEIENQIEYFKLHEVDFIVVVVPDNQLVEGIEGIDIVVSTQDEGLFVMGETIDSTFFVDAPEIGKVGAILISPSNVVSAKVIEEL